MIFDLDVEHKPKVTEMVEEALYLQKVQFFTGGAPYGGNQRLVGCLSVGQDFALVRDLDSGEVTAVNMGKEFKDLERYVLVDEALADDLLGDVKAEKDARFLAYQKAEDMIDELGAV